MQSEDESLQSTIVSSRKRSNAPRASASCERVHLHLMSRVRTHAEVPFATWHSFSNQYFARRPKAKQSVDFLKASVSPQGSL